MKICLGTVQFGLNYGIEKKRIDIDEVEKILKFSLKNNITILDTASGYGDSEIIIGNFNSHKFNIISKLDSKKLKNKNNMLRNLRQKIYENDSLNPYERESIVKDIDDIILGDRVKYSRRK